MRFTRFIILALSLCLAPLGLNAQSRSDTLADIRQELSFLFVEMQRLRQELSTTGSSGTSTSGTHLQRLDALEGELRRVTGQVEELEFRVERVVKDGTNRIGDLEFRLVELEGGDVSTLGQTSTLGGDTGHVIVTPIEPPNETTGELAISEEADFDAAKTAYDDADYGTAAGLFQTFALNYPGGPLTAEAHFWRGEALAADQDWSNAARSFLQSFSSTPDGHIAPRALMRLGVSLDKIGQREEACLTLNEVGLRYPQSPERQDAEAEMSLLDCGL